MTHRTVNLWNNESKSIGIFPSVGGFLAMTLSESKTFKTMDGAERWLQKRGYDAEGNLIDRDKITYPLYFKRPFDGVDRTTDEEIEAGQIPCGICGMPVTIDGAKHFGLVEAGKRWVTQNDRGLTCSIVPICDTCHKKHEVKRIPKTREEKLAVVWRHANKDSKGIAGDGRKTILVLRGGTTFVDLDDLTDKEIEDKLPEVLRSAT